MNAAPFTLLNAGRVIAGAGSLSRLPELVAEFNAKRVLLVSDKGVAAAGLVEPARQALVQAGFTITVLDNTPPTVVVPTTAGTGSEATPNSIILVPEDELKVGIVSPLLMPDAVILDPLLTLTLPAHITASTGMDALTHAIECYCSKKGNPFSDLYGLEAIRLIARSIRRAHEHGRDVQARSDMLLGAFYGGVCIATSSTTAVHALAYPLGGKYRIAHGLSNAMLLPFVMEFNLEGSEPRFASMARAMGLPVDGLADRAAGEKMIEALYDLNADLGIKSSLRGFDITPQDLDGLVEGAAKVTRLLDNNPRPMSKSNMRAVYERLM
jgi:alcohol dehydrogenase